MFSLLATVISSWPRFYPSLIPSWEEGSNRVRHVNDVNDEEIMITNAALIRKYELFYKRKVLFSLNMTVMLQISLIFQSTRRLQFSILLVMLQKWPRSSCYACIVAKHLPHKIIPHLDVLSNSRIGVNVLRQHKVSSMFTKKLRNILRGCLQLLGEVFHPANASQTQWLFPFWGPSTWQRCLDSKQPHVWISSWRKSCFWADQDIAKCYRL